MMRLNKWVISDLHQDGLRENSFVVTHLARTESNVAEVSRLLGWP